MLPWQTLMSLRRWRLIFIEILRLSGMGYGNRADRSKECWQTEMRDI